MKQDAKSFIVRIWIESAPDETGAPTWRGVIEHVGTSERKHFHDLTIVTQFIREKAGLQPPDPAPWWRSAILWIRNELRKRRPNLQ